MSDLTATVVVKRKLWLVKDREEKQIATIQAVHGTKNVVWVNGAERRQYPSMKVLRKTHNIIFDKKTKTKVTAEYAVCGYSTGEDKPYNGVFDAKRKLPIFTKKEKSKSFFCAGYYEVNIDEEEWKSMFCPKLLVLDRNQYYGPYKTSGRRS